MENINPKISVIVPVYNAEKYLQRCVDSILAQTFTDFELLLIDDGSKDKSGGICDEYVRKDDRVKVFHKENGGVSSARQCGLDNALGEYSIHVDSDDWIEPKMLERMYGKIIEMHADILISDFYIDKDGKSIYVDQLSCQTVPIDILKEILKGHLFGALWHKLIRHSLFKEHDIKFIPNINYCEDVLILAQILQLNVKVCFLHEAYYHYDQQNTNSITRNYTKETFNMRKRYVRALKDMVPNTFESIIKSVAFQVKREAFYNGVLDKDGFYNYMPTPLRYILFNKYEKRLKLCMILAYLGMFDLAKKIIGIR